MPILFCAVLVALMALTSVVDGRNRQAPLDKIAVINRFQHVYSSKGIMDSDIHVHRAPPRPLLAEQPGLSAATNQRARLWPAGVVPYELDSSIRRRPRNVKLIKVAMATWERETCLRFKKRHNETNFVSIYYGKGCTSDVGLVPGRAQLSLGRRCDDVGIILHELGHVIGFWHEQNRPDRDAHVRIIWSNIKPRYRFAFRRYSHFTVDSRGVPYDFQSVMHYGMKTFSRNGGLTIVPRDAAVKRLGGSRLSRLDVKQANLMYGCTAGREPLFPRDFFWWHRRKRAPYHCVHITEPADPTWRANTHLCYKAASSSEAGLRWTNQGPLPGMTCQHLALNRESVTRAWRDTFLCGLRDSWFASYHWSVVKRPVSGKSCLRIRGSRRKAAGFLCASKAQNSARDGSWSRWSSWQQCSKTCGGGYQRRVRMCSSPSPQGGEPCAGSSVQFRRCDPQPCQQGWPRWPQDFRLGVYRSVPPGSDCTRIFERKQYFHWLNFRVCWSRDRGDGLELRWSDRGPVGGMRCVQITEPGEESRYGWEDNFLCAPADAPYRFLWSSSGADPSLKCLRWQAKRAPHVWADNFLCAPAYPAPPRTAATAQLTHRPGFS